MSDEELRERIINELKEQYLLVPKTAKKFDVNDILEKYENQIIAKANIENNYSNKQAIQNALRKVTCIKNGCFNLKGLPAEKREKYRKDLEDLILCVLEENK